MGVAACPATLMGTGGRRACSPVESADPWPIAKVHRGLYCPPSPLISGFGFCFFALLGESISRGVSFVHLLRRNQVPSLEGRSLGSAVLLKTVGRVFADTGMPAEARAWAVGRAPFCTPSLLNEQL